MSANGLVSRVSVCVLAICGLVTAGSSAAFSQEKYTYQVRDSNFGLIGLYSTILEKIGDETIVTTEAHIKVSVLGISLYKQEASRIEHLRGDRLVSFHGITTENGRPFEVDGRADADNFIVVTPRGEFTAPKTIRSASPWSWTAGAPDGDVILMPDTGLIEKILVSGGEETSITIGGVSTRVRRSRIETADGTERYEIWVDEHRTPVMFNIQDTESTVTFVLIR